VWSMKTENSNFQSTDIKLIRFRSTWARTNCLFFVENSNGLRNKPPNWPGTRKKERHQVIPPGQFIGSEYMPTWSIRSLITTQNQQQNRCSLSVRPKALTILVRTSLNQERKKDSNISHKFLVTTTITQTSKDSPKPEIPNFPQQSQNDRWQTESSPKKKGNGGIH